jgi:hypothetical protein
VVNPLDRLANDHYTWYNSHKTVVALTTTLLTYCATVSTIPRNRVTVVSSPSISFGSFSVRLSFRTSTARSAAETIIGGREDAELLARSLAICRLHDLVLVDRTQYTSADKCTESPEEALAARALRCEEEQDKSKRWRTWISWNVKHTFEIGKTL